MHMFSMAAHCPAIIPNKITAHRALIHRPPEIWKGGAGKSQCLSVNRGPFAQGTGAFTRSSPQIPDLYDVDDSS
jgi:hypothetical protein